MYIRKLPTIFYVAVLLFATHQYMQFVLHIHIRMVDSFLDPLLLLPMALPLITLERRIMFDDEKYELPPLHVLGYLLLFSLVGEVLFPWLSTSFYADLLDVVAYAAGGVLYMIVQYRQRKNPGASPK